MDRALGEFGKFILLVIFTIAFGTLFAFPIKWCWNTTMPQIFSLIEITWLQAWCLNILCGSLIQSSFSHNKSTI